MDINELIAEGQSIFKTKPKSGYNRDIKDKQRYYTWTNNCETYLERIRFNKTRINQFKYYALNFHFDEMMGLLISIRDNMANDSVIKKHESPIMTNKVFIVHGHNEAVKDKVARVVEHLHLEPIILHEQPDGGKTIIEKFEANSADVNFAIVLLTADDLGKAKEEEKQNPRARQNVIFEMGYFMGRLTRSHVFMLLDIGVEKPSDLDGIVYTPLKEGWDKKLVKELKACGYKVDANDLL